MYTSFSPRRRRKFPTHHSVALYLGESYRDHICIVPNTCMTCKQSAPDAINVPPLATYTFRVVHDKFDSRSRQARHCLSRVYALSVIDRLGGVAARTAEDRRNSVSGLVCSKSSQILYFTLQKSNFSRPKLNILRHPKARHQFNVIYTSENVTLVCSKLA
jgi:hypothetical protein